MHGFQLPGTWKKAELINYLAESHSYRRYLELCTPTTGGLYTRINRTHLLCHRLMYRCPEGFSDGADIDFRSPDLDISACFEDIDERQIRYDIILVDPWHEYETSWRDLDVAFELLDPGGTIVVHDCLPPNEGLAVPHYKEGGWCGVTYRAYIDFVTSRRDLDYCTVDIDYGCGVIRKYASPRDAAPESDHYRALIESWRKIGDDRAFAFRFFQQNQEALLKLRSLEDFLQAERACGSVVGPVIDGQLGAVALAMYVHHLNAKGKTKAEAQECWRAIGPEGRSHWRLLARIAARELEKHGWQRTSV